MHAKYQHFIKNEKMKTKNHASILQHFTRGSILSFLLCLIIMLFLENDKATEWRALDAYIRDKKLSLSREVAKSKSVDNSRLQMINNEVSRVVRSKRCSCIKAWSCIQA